MSQRPIADYALLSDCHGAALVSRAGSIDWLCMPRFDSPALLSALLDEQAGHWAIAPSRVKSTERRYLENSLVLETTFHTVDRAIVQLTDALAVGPNEHGHELGASSPHTLLREIRCERGEADVVVSYAPRPEYGLIVPLLQVVPGGLLARGGASVLMLSSAADWESKREGARARFRLREGDSAYFALQHSSSANPVLEPWEPGHIASRLEHTVRGWQSWSRLHQRYRGPWCEQVWHSGRVLQALTYAPTGAIAAAATTSLPEVTGGGRNWDYRYSWVRDASMTIEALWVAACPDEAHRFFDFLAHAALPPLEAGDPMQIMFGVGGEHDLSERELPHLSGWRDSRPVRIGNAAWQQRQLDVYGELLAAAARLSDQLGELGPITQGFLIAVANAAAARWREPDQGIWELRGEPRHFLHSKLMCWVALDRAIRLAPRIGAQGQVARWASTRDEIRQAILDRGWSDRAGAYTQAFDHHDLDASVLAMALVGFVPADDPRMLATIEAIDDRLTDDHGLVYRYRAGDGLEGDEGAFVLCTFWLAHAWALAGRLDRARDVFGRAERFANDVGLLAEEVDATSGELLGNVPQAFSHIGLINAAWAIHELEQQTGEHNERA